MQNISLYDSCRNNQRDSRNQFQHISLLRLKWFNVYYIKYVCVCACVCVCVCVCVDPMSVVEPRNEGMQ